MRTRTDLVALAVAVCAAVGGCGGGDNSLTGSIASSHALAFDSVLFRQVATSYVLQYTSGAQIPFKLIYTGAAPAVNQTVNLDFSATGNAAVTRATSDLLMFPAASGGTLTLGTDLTKVTEGSTVSGRFGVKFTSGQTVNGTFAAPFSKAVIN